MIFKIWNYCRLAKTNEHDGKHCAAILDKFLDEFPQKLQKTVEKLQNFQGKYKVTDEEKQALISKVETDVFEAFKPMQQALFSCVDASTSSFEEKVELKKRFE